MGTLRPNCELICVPCKCPFTSGISDYTLTEQTRFHFFSPYISQNSSSSPFRFDDLSTWGLTSPLWRFSTQLPPSKNSEEKTAEPQTDSPQTNRPIRSCLWYFPVKWFHPQHQIFYCAINAQIHSILILSSSPKSRLQNSWDSKLEKNNWLA